MAIQSTIFIFVIAISSWKRKKKDFFFFFFCAWFLGVRAEGTKEKENEKEQDKPTTACRHTHKLLHGQEDLGLPS